jgi:hypothetical protein
MMRMRNDLVALIKSFLILFGAGFLLACAPCNDNKDLLTIPVKSSMSVVGDDLQSYREQLQKLSGTGNMTQIVSGMVGGKYANAKSSASLVEKNMDGGQSVYGVVLVFDDVPDDDSSSGYRYDIKLNESNDKLEIVSMKESWRCWPDRGHRDFSTEPCE